MFTPGMSMFKFNLKQLTPQAQTHDLIQSVYDKIEEPRSPVTSYRIVDQNFSVLVEVGKYQKLPQNAVALFILTKEIFEIAEYKQK